jgi:hypothetical protein
VAPKGCIELEGEEKAKQGNDEILPTKELLIKTSVYA